MSSEIASTMALRQYHTRLAFRHHKRLAYHHLTAHAHELESRVAYEVFHPGGGSSPESGVAKSCRVVVVVVTTSECSLDATAHACFLANATSNKRYTHALMLLRVRLSSCRM